MFCRYTGSSSKNYSRRLQHSGKFFTLCRSLIGSGSEPFILEEQLLSVEGAIFPITNLETLLGNKANFSWFDLPQPLNSYLNPSSISNSLRSDLPSDLVDFGLKLSNLFISELFQLYMLFFTINSSIFTLIWSIFNLISCSPYVLDLFREPHMCCWKQVVPPPELC